MYISINVENQRVTLAYGEGTSRTLITGSKIVKTQAEIKDSVVVALKLMVEKAEKGELVVVPRDATVDESNLNNIPSRGGEFWKFATKNLRKFVPDQVWKDSIAHAYKATKSATPNSDFYKVLETEIMSHVAKADKNAAKGNKK